MMLANLALMLLIFIVILGEVLVPFYHEMFKIDDIYAQHYSAKFFIVLLDRISLALFAVLLISLIYQMIINHKFCGPLVNFSHTFKKVAQGDLTRKVYLRRYDFHKNEAAQVNDMIDFLSDHIKTLKRDHEQLLSTINGVSGSQIKLSENQNVLEALKKQADICHQHLSVFKIDGIDDQEN